MNQLRTYLETQLPLSDVQPLVDCFSVRKILIKGEGHFPHEGQPERMTELLYQWMKKLEVAVAK